MKKILKKLMFVAGISSFCLTSVVAEKATTADHYIKSDFEIKLNGYSHFQAGYRNQSNLSREEKNVSMNKKDFAFYNDSGFLVTASKAVNNVNYGAKIALVPTAKKTGSSSYNGSHIFIETSYGKFEAGSPISAGSNMFIDAGIIAAGSGDWDRYADFSTDSMKQSDQIKGKTIDGVVFDGNTELAPSFAVFAEFFLDSKLVTKLDNRTFSSEPSRAISYYTPKFELGDTTKAQVGVSYIPDSSNTGADSPSNLSSGKREIKLALDGKEAFEIDSSVKNAFTGGVCVEQNFADGVDLKIAFTGEYGKSAGKAVRKSTNTEINNKTYNLADLRTYNIGGVLNIGNFSYGASYGSLGKSLTTPAFHKTGRNTTYYTGAVAYKIGPFNTSVSYFRSDQYKNTVDAVSVATDFKLAPGLKPYAEISGFSLKGRPEFYPELSKKKTRGTVALLGLKLSL